MHWTSPKASNCWQTLPNHKHSSWQDDSCALTTNQEPKGTQKSQTSRFKTKTIIVTTLSLSRLQKQHSRKASTWNTRLFVRSPIQKESSNRKTKSHSSTKDYSSWNSSRRRRWRSCRGTQLSLSKIVFSSKLHSCLELVRLLHLLIRRTLRKTWQTLWTVTKG